MPDLLFTLHCATRDTELLVDAIRAVSPTPIHVRGDAVRGRDFGDAGTAERVSGELKRSTLELIVSADAVPDLLRTVKDARRDLPVRWRTTPLLDHGRIA